MERRDRAGDDNWVRQRHQAITAHDAARRRRQAKEAREASALLTDFVGEARRTGLATQPLTARPHRGGARYRTGLRGWYIKVDRSLAVGTDGNLYLLSVPASMRGWLTGVRVTPIEPRLVIGAGGRDGESVPLAALLDQRLTGGSASPRPGADS
ncbi:hypothetical protein ACN27F_28400 [Solwaraspora sp. WMMB335]|uniref:hypothetical protein n=1 Tax=Solwaraspora sp. WMMB335 TaxID=3404118 RepID=UPI003B93AD6B